MERSLLWHKTRTRLKNLTDEKIIVNFPRRLELLFDLEKYNEKPIDQGLKFIEISYLDDLIK
jgi:hypothetical protein